MNITASRFNLLATTAISLALPLSTVQAQIMEEIVVTSRAAKLYRIDSTSVGKLPTAPLESSQMVAAITEQLIADQGARDAQDLYRNISGVTFYSFAGVAARGFRQEEIYYDGLRGDPNVGFAVPQLFNIERVEFLKGPAGMLYGPGAPGGLFNYVTKKPHDYFEGSLRAVIGDEDRSGAMAVINGPLGGGVSGRAGIFYEDKGLLRNNAFQESIVADLGLSYDVGSSRFILQATRYDMIQDGARLRGVPVDDDGNFLTSVRWSANEPDDFLKMKSDVFQASVQSELTSNLTFDATLRYNDATEQQHYHELNSLFDSNEDGSVDSVRREYREQRRNNENWSFGANAVWSKDISADVQNRVLVGLDRFTGTEDRFASRLRGNTSPRAGLPDPISIFNPVYGRGAFRNYNSAAMVPNLIDSDRAGYYLLNEVTFGKFIVVGGLRYDDFEDDVNGIKFEDDEVTYRLGGVYRPRDDISFFLQYATSFEPQSPSSQIPEAGGPFAPSDGDMVEAGVKTALMDGRFQASAAIYQIKRANVLQDDPRGDVDNDGFDDLLPVGEVTSEGFELDLAVDITPDWVATVNYAYNKTRITGGFSDENRGLGDNVGDRFANAPENTFGFWTRYQFGDTGLAAAFGGDYVSKRLSVDGQTVKAYDIYDASLIYDFGDWRAMLRVDNLFDKDYATAGFRTHTGHYPGRPRTAFLELIYTIE